MSVTRIILFLLLLISFAALPAAAQADSALLKKNIVAKNDTLPQLVPHDPKQDFKDLFIGVNDVAGDYSVALNPRAVSFVDDYMQKHKKHLTSMKDWGRPYFNMMDNILTAHGVPPEMKYLAVIESNLKSYALSWAGAVGPWQFMPGTARRMGLRVNRYLDERTDYYKSTHAAAKYMTELFSIYGDWLLVVAAYNGGPGNVNAAIRKSGSRNFWNLQNYLPEESRNHVKKFIATHYIMEGNGGITTVTKEEANDIVLTSNTLSNLSADEIEKSKTQSISGKYNAGVIARYISMDLAAFNRYNPGFDKQIAIRGVYELRLPGDKMEIFNSKRFQVLDESLKLLLAPAAGK